MKEVVFNESIVKVNIEFTEHVKERMIEREISEKDVNDLIESKMNLILTKVYTDDVNSVKQRIFNDDFSIVFQASKQMDMITLKEYYNIVVITVFKTEFFKEISKSINLIYEIDVSNKIKKYDKVRISLTNFAKKTMKANLIDNNEIINLILKGKKYIFNDNINNKNKEGVDYKFIHSKKNFSVIINSKTRENKAGRYIDLTVIKVDLYLYGYEKIKKKCKRQYFI